MTQRRLCVVANERELGLVAYDTAGARFEGATARVFARVRAERGDEAATRSLIEEGWSNGYLYLREAEGAEVDKPSESRL